VIPALEQLTIGQRIPEYRVWLGLCIAMGIRSYVELGTGASHCLFAAGVPRVIAVDINNIDGAHPHNPHRVAGVTYLQGDSHDPATLARVRDLLDGPPECVFIDADHAYDAVAADYALWSPAATRLIGFHDVLIPDVARLWREVSLGIPSVKIIGCDFASAASWQGQGAPPDGVLSAGGIGVLFKE
jgi:23S rRNA U2552 (ribose-2'-O)-methylase RlmE/FtsJ